LLEPDAEFDVYLQGNVPQSATPGAASLTSSGKTPLALCSFAKYNLTKDTDMRLLLIVFPDGGSVTPPPVIVTSEENQVWKANVSNVTTPDIVKSLIYFLSSR